VKRAFPWIVLGLAAAYAAAHLRPMSTSADGYRVQDFARLPVVHNGRVKPLDTFARTQLRVLADRESCDYEARKNERGEPVLERRPAARWMLDLLADALDGGDRARKYKAFRIVHPQLLAGLGLPEVEGFRYSVADFGDKLSRLGKDMQTAHQKAEAKGDLDAHERALLEFGQHLKVASEMMSLREPHVVPPSAGHAEWRTLPEAHQVRGAGAEAVDPHAAGWVRVLETYGRGDAAAFNAEVAGLLAQTAAQNPSDATAVGFEVFFNVFDPFLICKVFYITAFVLSALAWLGWAGPLNRAAFRLILFSWTLHTLALVARIYMSGRPPVTNLYSSAIFIGWGTVIGGLLFERLFRLGVGNVVASASGFATLLIAYILSADGDTMEVMQAVLDTTFWLATHVTTITMGYATTFGAGLVGLIYVVSGMFTRSLTEERRGALARMIYGMTCFAMFFSFVGTVLGGLWADDSWGRFWGWDPKENGALMIVLWNALILHARWGGLVRERGLATLAVFGNVVTAWSWFGVNNLGKGLHAYGFTEGREWWLWMFAFSQTAVIGLGMMPRRFWKSPDAVRGGEEPKAAA
jgi:ABC-type transport system involved in cytochrome c biogenesis permease subunit